MFLKVVSHSLAFRDALAFFGVVTSSMCCERSLNFLGHSPGLSIHLKGC